MVLMYGDEKDVEEVFFFLNYYGKFEWCYVWFFLIDQEVCVSVDYFNVISFILYVYFFLFGFFFVLIFRKNRYIYVY